MAAFTYTIGERSSLGNLIAVPVKAIWSSSTYTTGGEPITAAALGLNVIKSVAIEDSAGYTFDAVVSTGTSPTAPAGYRFLLKSYVASGGASGAGSAHSHAVLLDTGSSAAGSAHSHTFTGTAITADTFTVAHDATPETTPLYVATQDGLRGYFNSDCSGDNVSDYFSTAGGAKGYVYDNNGSNVGFAVYFNVAASAGQRLCCNNTITATDLYVPLSNGTIVKVLHDASAATYRQCYFDDNGADHTLYLNCNQVGAANITDNAISTAYKAHGDVAAGTNANESAHTHGAGTLADAASGTENAHTHTNAAGSAEMSGSLTASIDLLVVGY